MCNMLRASILILLALSSFALVESHDGDNFLEFLNWMKLYDKQYDAQELISRYEIFNANVQFVRDQNKKWIEGIEPYYLTLNQFADLRAEEFEARYLKKIQRVPKPFQEKDYHAGGPRPHASVATTANIALSNDSPRGVHISHRLKAGDNTSLDWQQLGYVTPVGDQGYCSSYYAFAAAGSVESAVAIKHGNLIALSEQQIVDCTTSYGNLACSGGSYDDTYPYIVTHGLCSLASYPYEGRQGTCRSGYCSAVAYTKISTWTEMVGENAIYQAIQYLPIAVSVEADSTAFRLYSGGVFSAPCGQRLDHQMLVVGYGVDNNTSYWRLKNSWGTSWGEQGYMRMIRGVNECGIGIMPAYPRVN